MTARLKHPRPKDTAAEGRHWRFRHTECDLAGHINNSAYLEPLEEELLDNGGWEPEQLDLEIEFRTPAQPGDKVVLRDGHWRWIVDGAETHASMVLRDQTTR